MNKDFKIFILVIIIGIISQPVRADERIWVHVNYLEDYINSLCFYGGAVPITMNFRLYDNNGYYLDITPHSCIDKGTISTECGPQDGGYWRLSTAWYIDEVTGSTPTVEDQSEMICDPYGDCVLSWYYVDIPTGFEPTSYRYGCSDLYDSFQMPTSNTNTDDTSTTDTDNASTDTDDTSTTVNSGGGGGCFISSLLVSARNKIGSGSE